jgi:hypothetical protein
MLCRTTTQRHTHNSAERKKEGQPPWDNLFAENENLAFAIATQVTTNISKRTI